jgi:tripartite-type tricarboxylate transporter receptor subunit TctC
MSSKPKLLGALLAATLLSPLASEAQSFPDRPIDLIVGYPPGATVDLLARQYAVRLEQALGVPVVVQNRPGAAQLLGISNLVNAAPDGYTISLMGGGALSQAPAVRDDLPYETMVDFVSVALVATAAGVFTASNDLAADDMGDLIAYARENPGALNFGSSGIGTASHLQLELLEYLADIEMEHIPYEGASQIQTAIMGGEIDLGVGPINSSLEAIEAGQIKALGITGDQRSPILPDVPSLSELNIPELSALDPYTYYYVVAPKDTPAEIIGQLNAAINEVTASAEMNDFLVERGFNPMAMSAEEGRDFVFRDLETWRDFRENTGFEFATQ